MRAFFAIELGEPARRAAADLARRLRDAAGGSDVRWVRPDAYHLTLRFLGEVAAERVEGLAAAAAAALASAARIRVQLAGLGALPSVARPRVVVLDVEPEPPLAALAARLEQIAVEQGFPIETRAFRAHLTLGRVRRGRGPALGREPRPAASPFDVNEVVLFQSRLGSYGSVYTPLARLPLGGARAAVQSVSDSSRTQASQGEMHGP